jgi:pimeloyl-ACP methyl ester carboxylesterase
MATRLPRARFKEVCLIHERGGAPDGIVQRLQELLERNYKKISYNRPLLPHSNPHIRAERSLEWMDNFTPFLPRGILLVGIGLGGLLAAKIQEMHPELDLSVFAVCAPTELDFVKLEKKVDKRAALYSSVMRECRNWPEFSSQAFDVPWLAFNPNPVKHSVAYLLACYLRGWNIEKQVRTLFPEPAPDKGEIYQL